MTVRAVWLTFTLLLGAACAKEENDFGDEADTEVAGRGGKGQVGSSGSGVSISGTSVVGGAAGANASTSAGNSGKSGTGGSGTAGRGGSGSGGTAGTASGAGGSLGGGGSAGSGGQAGGPNQPTMCDDASSTSLGTMSSNVKVASNVCLKMTLPSDQTWIKKLTLQPDSGTYPLPFTWSNCGTNSSGAFTANYANAVLDPVTAQCPIFVKLGGSGAPINIQWWGG